MSKYDDEIKAIAGRADKEDLKALWSIANEIAELNKFLRKENRDALDAIEREFGVKV